MPSFPLLLSGRQAAHSAGSCLCVFLRPLELTRDSQLPHIAFNPFVFFFLNYRSFKPCSSYPSLLLLHSVHHTDRQRRLMADRHVTATGGAGGPLALRSHSVPRNEIHRQPPSRPVPWCFLGARIHDDCCSFHTVTFGHSIISFSNVPP